MRIEREPERWVQLTERHNRRGECFTAGHGRQGRHFTYTVGSPPTPYGMTSRQVTGTLAAGLASWRNGKRKGRTQSMIGHPHIRGSWFRRAEPPQDDRTAGAASFYPR